MPRETARPDRNRAAGATRRLHLAVIPGTGTARGQAPGREGNPFVPPTRSAPPRKAVA